MALRSVFRDLGIPMKVEIQSDSSTANSLTDPLGAKQRTKHIDTRYFWIQERVQDGDLSIKKVPTAKKCADVGTKPVSASVLQQHCKVLQDWYSTDRGSHTPLQDGGSSRRRAGEGAGDGAAAQKQTLVNVGREHRDGCATLSETIER